MNVLDVNNKNVSLEITASHTVTKVTQLVNGYHNALSDMAEVLHKHHTCSVSCEPESNIDFIKRNLIDSLAPKPAALKKDIPLPTAQPMPINMEMITSAYTYGELVSVGWRDEQMVDVGFAKYIAPTPTNIPSPAPLCLNDDERVVAEWLNGAWYYAAQGVGKKITELLNPPLSPIPVTTPASFVLDEDLSIYPMWDGARKQWMTPFSNLDLVFSCLKRDSAPVAPESHLLYPVANGKQDRITSKSVNGEAMFNANEVFKCFGAWEHTDAPVYSALNKLREVLDAKGFGYIGIIELAIKELSCLKVADEGFDAHLAHYTPGRITGALNNWYYPIEEVDGLIRRLVRQVRKVNRKYAELMVSHKHIVSEDERLFKYLGECGAVANPGEYGSTNAILFIKQCMDKLSDVECHNQLPGIVVCGDQAVVESLADQWVQIYKTVHPSAGGAAASEAAHKFIELVK